MRAPTGSKVADLRARLKELDEPTYGDKHTLWTRLKKAEAALNARRASARDYVEKHSERRQALREGRGRRSADGSSTGHAQRGGDEAACFDTPTT